MLTFRSRRTSAVLVLLWLAFVVRGFYCALLPPWERYDELQLLGSSSGCIGSVEQPTKIEMRWCWRLSTCVSGRAWRITSLITFLYEGVSASNGWYLYDAVVAAEGILVVWGLETFLPGHVVFPSLTIALAGLDLYGMHALLMPYYTGLTDHRDGSVPPEI